MNTLSELTYEAYERLLDEPHGQDDWAMPAAVWAWRDGTLVAKVSVYSTDMGPVGAAVQWCAEGLAADAVVLLTPVSGTGDGEDLLLVLTGADRQARIHVIESKVAHLDGESISVEDVADVDLDRSAFVPALLRPCGDRLS